MPHCGPGQAPLPVGWLPPCAPSRTAPRGDRHGLADGTAPATEGSKLGSASVCIFLRQSPGRSGALAGGDCHSVPVWEMGPVRRCGTSAMRAWRRDQTAPPRCLPAARSRGSSWAGKRAVCGEGGPGLSPQLAGSVEEAARSASAQLDGWWLSRCPPPATRGCSTPH